MKASTIKIENPLLTDIYALKPSKRSLSAFVRSMLEEGVRQRRMREAAEQYSRFLKANPEEARWLGEWESADLAKPAKKGKTKRRRN